MENRHSVWQLPAQLLAGVAMASALLFTAQAQAAGNHQGGARSQVQPLALKTQGGHHHGDVHAGGRGHPTSVRPHRPHHPPRPVIVVPPCKRGGRGITPC